MNRRMFNPPHPGAVLREYMGDMTIADLSARIHIHRVTLSRILAGKAPVTPDVAVRLGRAFSTSANLWAGMQLQHDLALAEKNARADILPIAAGRRPAHSVSQSPRTIA